MVPPIATAAVDVPRAASTFDGTPRRRDEPAPLLETVLAPAEPFELLEPAPEAAVGRPVTSSDELAEAPATASAGGGVSGEEADRVGAAEHTIETIAKIVAAEAVAAAADSAPVAERRETPVAEQPAQPRPSYDERPRTARVEPLTGPIAEQTASDVDEFEAASRMFSFASEVPVRETAADEAPAEDTARAAASSKPHAAPRRARAARGASFKRVATASFSIGVFGIVGLMAVGMTTPVEAVAAASGADASMSVVAPAKGTVVTEIDEDEIQAYVAPASAQNDTLDRTENYATTTMAELASEAGIKNFSNLFRNDPNSNIQWPFAVGVTMSYGFGMRSGRMHQGVDFTPGAGAPIQAIADGTVRVASEAGGAYGVHVIIDHMIDGQLVSSHYAHMQYGSMEVTPGQHVTVGTILGRTGNTGRSYGAHTHFEILVNGTTAIDPMAWLREHTDGTHTVG
ncbi:M23 family metallopeptidase [Microbacterium cremeum]|uniref:M23 family metallopeptidase n=1 Tax=Microbacterium cremeum TaxID=2782169 RepID=UPI001E60353D|nr:M23 family metallopeptidase [Microbacterium cremeum]